MGEVEIKEKLREVLSRENISEVELVYIFSRIRKILEPNKGADFPIVYFYCNWALHVKINKVPQALLDELIRSHEEYTASPFIVHRSFYEELVRFLEKHNLPQPKIRPVQFLDTMVKIYSDTPVILNGQHEIIIQPGGMGLGSSSITHRSLN
jgi:hypothetical protein